MFRRTPVDPRQAHFVTLASLRWIIRNRAWSPWYLLRYWRFLMFRLRNPHIITEGFVFIGKNVTLSARKGYGRLILGRWIHLGEGNLIDAHEGTLRVGSKTVFGRNNTVQSFLDVEIGGSCIVADWVYICDFDHVFSDIHMPIKDQGIVKTPVRIGPDCWIGTKVTVLRGTTVGTGSVLAANSVVRGTVAPGSVVGGVPARLLKDRTAAYEADAQRRVDLADIARKTALAAEQTRLGQQGTAAALGQQLGFHDSGGPAGGPSPSAAVNPAGAQSAPVAHEDSDQPLPSTFPSGPGNTG